MLSSGTEAVSAGLDTEGEGIPVVVFNPLNIARKDIVETSLSSPGGLPKTVHVVAPDGSAEAAQISGGKVEFEASVNSVGYSVYHVLLGGADAVSSQLRVTSSELENAYYKLALNADGDVSSIFD